MKTAVILATGHPAHKSQLAQDRPRAMLPALGKPMVVRVMEQFYRAGIRHYILILGLNEGGVASYLSRQWVPDATFEIILQTENDDLLTSLIQIAKKRNEPFLFASYNSFTHERFAISLLRLQEENPSNLILTGAKSALSLPNQAYYANTEGQKIFKISLQKPESAQHATLLDYASCGQSFITYLTALQRDPKETFGQNFLEIVEDYLTTPHAAVTLGETSWILRIESDSHLLMLNRKLLEDSNDSHILSELPFSVKIIPPVRIDPLVSVGEGATIGPNVYLEKGASVGYGATVSNALILGRGVVSANTRVENAIVSIRGAIT